MTKKRKAAVKNKGNEQLDKKKENITNDVVSLDILHPLEYSWNLWIFMNDKEIYEDNLVCLTTFDTVEDFWRLYHHIKLPTELQMGQNYLYFKKGVHPTWEDPGNKKGGRWIINWNKTKDDLNILWLHLVLLMIGENFEHADIISGAVVNIGAKCKISLWLANASNQNKVKDIGRTLKENINNIGKINFHCHNSSVNLCTM